MLYKIMFYQIFPVSVPVSPCTGSGVVYSAISSITNTNTSKDYTAGVFKHLSPIHLLLIKIKLQKATE